MALIFCYLQSQEAERDTQYAEYDLEAQQDMAEWAYALLLVSVGGLAVSSIGLALLFWSLRQTQTTIKDNRKIGQAQTRAYLTVDGGGYDIAHAYLTINVSLRNTGASPAHNIVIRTTFEARVRKVSGGNLPQHDLLTFSPKPVTVGDLQASAKRPCTIYFHWDSGNNDTWDRILTHIDDGGAFGVIAKIEWTDVFGV